MRLARSTRSPGAQQLGSPGDQGSPRMSVVVPNMSDSPSGNRFRARRERADPSTTHHVLQKHAQHRWSSLKGAGRSTSFSVFSIRAAGEVLAWWRRHPHDHRRDLRTDLSGRPLRPRPARRPARWDDRAGRPDHTPPSPPPLPPFTWPPPSDSLAVAETGADLRARSTSDATSRSCRRPGGGSYMSCIVAVEVPPPPPSPPPPPLSPLPFLLPPPPILAPPPPSPLSRRPLPSSLPSPLRDPTGGRPPRRGPRVNTAAITRTTAADKVPPPPPAADLPGDHHRPRPGCPPGEIVTLYLYRWEIATASTSASRSTSCACWC